MQAKRCLASTCFWSFCFHFRVHVSDILTVSPLIEDDVLFSFSELFRDWKMGYYLLLLHKCLEYFGLSESTCFSFLLAHQLCCSDHFTCAEEALQVSWSCLLGTALVCGQVAPRQGVNYSHLVVMVCKGTAAGKGPFTIRLSSGMLYVSLGFIYG